MNNNQLKRLEWYRDHAAINRKEPGIVHSFAGSLASAVNHLQGHLDPVWLMGASGFAFKIWVNEIMCPSAMSMFSWDEVLPEAVEQAGYKCRYIGRMWEEAAFEETRRLQAQEAIIESIGQGIPAVVWDVSEAEWGLITGYDLDRETYSVRDFRGAELSLEFDKLGRNGIDVLSVTIPAESNAKSREEIIRQSLETALKHVGGEEWTDRPEYENGLAAYEMWADNFDKWGLLVKYDKTDDIEADITGFARYYAAHYYSARCYARDYLAKISDGNDLLEIASQAYRNTADNLRQAMEKSPQVKNPDRQLLESIAENIITAKNSEAEALEYIEKYLDK